MGMSRLDELVLGCQRRGPNFGYAFDLGSLYNRVATTNLS